jgi:hypothetical protein
VGEPTGEREGDSAALAVADPRDDWLTDAEPDCEREAAADCVTLAERETVRVAAADAREAATQSEILALQRSLTETALELVSAKASLRASEEGKQKDRLIMSLRIAELESAIARVCRRRRCGLTP